MKKNMIEHFGLVVQLKKIYDRYNNEEEYHDRMFQTPLLYS